jgi:uncharacterized membrane protein YebE (DUF533 family)
MSWLDEPEELSAGAAAAIALAMRKVARADGMVHPRELALIAQFESELPDGVTPASTLSASEAKVLIQSVLMVALADGRISEAEEATIAELSRDLGIADDKLGDLTDQVKREFLHHFAGRATFRASVLQVARELGLEAPELAALSGEV